MRGTCLVWDVSLRSISLAYRFLQLSPRSRHTEQGLRGSTSDGQLNTPSNGEGRRSAILAIVPPDAKPTILLIEDFDDAREMYADYLEFSGFLVLTAPDAKRGLEIAEARQPDLILMDAGLPGMSGWEACSSLKASPATRAIPVIMLTGHVFGGSRKQSIQVGADGFLAKPCLPDDLVREIRLALRRPPGEIATAHTARRELESGEPAVEKGRTGKPAKRARRHRGGGTS